MDAGQAGQITGITGQDDSAAGLDRDSSRMRVRQIVRSQVGLGEQRAYQAGQVTIGVPDEQPVGCFPSEHCVQCPAAAGTPVELRKGYGSHRHVPAQSMCRRHGMTYRPLGGMVGSYQSVHGLRVQDDSRHSCVPCRPATLSAAPGRAFELETGLSLVPPSRRMNLAISS